jgi:hypothetical protein
MEGSKLPLVYFKIKPFRINIQPTLGGAEYVVTVTIVRVQQRCLATACSIVSTAQI